VGPVLHSTVNSNTGILADGPVSGHFGTRTLRHQDTSALMK